MERNVLLSLIQGITANWRNHISTESHYQDVKELINKLTESAVKYAEYLEYNLSLVRAAPADSDEPDYGVEVILLPADSDEPYYGVEVILLPADSDEPYDGVEVIPIPEDSDEPYDGVEIIPLPNVETVETQRKKIKSGYLSSPIGSRHVVSMILLVLILSVR